MKSKTSESAAKAASKTTAAAKGKKATATRASAKTAKKTAAPRKKELKLIKNDSWLKPYEAAIEGRHDHALYKLAQLSKGSGKLSDFADGHLYFGTQ